jgi:2-hydroxychromene-2-carboxylate isomerase
MNRSIRFYLDYISHNAWIAWTQIHALAGKYQCSVTPVPVLFAGLLQAHGQLGPAEVPPKVRWMLRNTLRKAVQLNIPLNPPASHPFNPLLALRVSSLEMDAATRQQLVDSLFRATWAEGLDVTNPAVVARIAAESGLAGRDVLAEAAEPAAKDRVRKQTDEAIRLGVFGVPTMQVGDELFWGYDDFPYLELYLAGRDPLPRNFETIWSSVRSSAIRRKSPKP